MTDNKTKFNNIRQAIISQNIENRQRQLNKIDDFKPDENHKTMVDLIHWMQRNILEKRTLYKGTLEQQINKTKQAITKHHDDITQKELNYIEEIEQAPDTPPNDIIITVEWKNSRTWGSNPTATDNYGNISGSIGGCGYCKLSTATANILNQHPTLIKSMCKLKEQNVEQDNRTAISYGAGHNITPQFEGGVGISSHMTLLAKLGYTMQQVSNTQNTDVFIISRNA